MARRPVREADISPEIEARSVADHAVGLAMSLSLACDDRHGVYADAARWELGRLRQSLVKIEAAVALMPTAKPKAVA